MAPSPSKGTLLALRDSDPTLIAFLREKYEDVKEELVFADAAEVPTLQGRGRELDSLIRLIETSDQKIKEVHKQESRKS